MIKIDGIERRNLQEQVGYNSEKIKEIFEFLDGLNVEDNLIKLTASSGTLTPEEMEIVSRDIAFIIYNDNLYVKTTTSPTEFIFKQLALSASNQGTYNILQSFRIIVTRASGTYAYSSNTLLSLYDKSQADVLLGNKADSSYVNSQLSLKANLAGANFTGNITSPSIIENMSGYSFMPDGQAQTNGFIFSYAGIVKNGNKLTLVIAGTFTRNENTTYNTTVGSFNVPTAVHNKLYPNSLGSLGNKTILLFSSTTNYVEIPARSSKGGTSISIEFYKSGNVPVLNTTYSFRYEETFLLSDNLAS